jgi:hypothetical protein
VTKTIDEQFREREAMRRAINAYTGPITRCPPGKARGRPVEPLLSSSIKAEAERLADDDTAKFLKLQRRSAELRKAVRREGAIKATQKRKRIVERNAPTLKKVEKQDRTFRRNLALIKEANR